MRTKNLSVLIFIMIVAISLVSCEEEEFGENETVISRHNEFESHKNGEDCMNCHISGGSGEGWFAAAGSVYDSLKTTPYANATIRLYTGPNETGVLIKTIEVDGKGNLFTSENIDFNNGLYATVTGTTGSMKNMNSIIKTGQCNSCHGESIDRIWIN